MNSKKAVTILLILFVGSMLFNFVGCKKLDLVRIAAVRTDPATNIYSDQAKVNGEIIDLGEENSLLDHGFCWSTGTAPPTINNSNVSLGSRSDIINYFFTITGLASNTTYKFRAYIRNASQLYYGEVFEFKTLPGTTPTGEWLHYDDGFNNDGIGLTEGGSFDLAIRFTTFDLQDYNGFEVTRIRFFPREGNPTLYYSTLWHGSTPDLEYAELISNPLIGNWTEYYPTQIYTINSNVELWIGIWVFEHPAGLYPAGVDDGPAVPGKSDLFSQDDGTTWESLADLGLNYNWNLQVYVTNEKGVEVELVKKDPQREAVYHDRGTGSNPFSTFNSSINN
jgi:hypothetical protein